MQNFDVLILGTGLAGLTLALKIAHKKRVCLVSKKALQDSASYWAQGGIAGVLSDEDSLEEHLTDTLKAGAGLSDPVITRKILSHAQAEIDWLIKQGVLFSREGENYHLTQEGGHSHRRIIHSQDNTGKTVQDTLIQKIKQHPNITLFEEHIAVDLITSDKYTASNSPNQCFGAYLFDNKTKKVKTISAYFSVLATGGAGRVYLYTSNPDIATGDGIAMAWRAGCRIANMEFIQFHPTCLYHPQAKSFLISEALRGEGGILKLPNGKRFMPDHDEKAELAPRDLVARAIDFEMKKWGLDHVYLDISHKSTSFIQEHFPTIYQRCKELGIDITKSPIPVVPAAHYTCGGVMTNEYGQTDLINLYAIGETAYTGLHGANRLASNSLLECLVMGNQTADHVLQSSNIDLPSLRNWDESRVTDSDEEIIITHNWNELRRCMWNYVGIVRTNKRLLRASHRITLLKEEIGEFYSNFRISYNLVELRNLVLLAEIIVKSAIQRSESRGLHYNRDSPHTKKMAEVTILRKE